MSDIKQDNRTDLERFRPEAVEKNGLQVTYFHGLCKSCGECIVKCPVKCISWSDTELGQLGEKAIVIDLDKCIGCETCEVICPDHAIEINDTRRQKK